ncbi:MAG: hypothetical protein JWR80_2657 [Bradyrhizobium sp.]|nr:hypothetical protein [Bradyrhizobium sp.]
MISTTGYGRIVLLTLAAAFGMASALPARAQTPPADDNPKLQATEAEAANEDDPDLKDLQLDWSQLNIDASTLTGHPLSKARLPAQASDTTWSAKDKPSSSAVSVKQALSPFWDTKVGADMTVARPPQTMSEILSEKAANGGNLARDSGSAWAAITAPGVGSVWDKTSVEARLDPGQDQSKLGTSLSKSLPLGDQYSLTLQNGYNVIQQGTVAIPGVAGHPSRNYEVDRSAKLSITDSGTSLIAGQWLSSTDDKWLGKIGAEQKLFGGVTISGSIGETAQGTANKSLSAGFKRSW